MSRQRVLRSAPTIVADSLPLPPKLPEIPRDVLERFPSLRGYQQEHDDWWRRAYLALQENVRDVSSAVSVNGGIQNLYQTVNGLNVSLELQQEIIDNQEEFLEAGWVLKASVGHVVTAMRLYSGSGPDTEVSEVTFQTDVFKIATSSGTPTQIFSATASAVKLGDVLTVDLASGKVYIGAGNYATSDTAFFIDSAGRMSLKDKFVWDGSNLSINGSGTFSGTLSAASGSFSGSITSSSGTIGGFGIQSTYLSAGSGISSVLLRSGPTPAIKFGDTTYSQLAVGELMFVDGSNSLASIGWVGTIGNRHGVLFLHDATGTPVIESNASTGYVYASGFSGSGAYLTSLNASNISSGTLDNARLPSAISVTSLAGSGGSITGLSASNVSSGTLNNARLPSSISVTSVTGTTLTAGSSQIGGGSGGYGAVLVDGDGNSLSFKWDGALKVKVDSTELTITTT